MKKIALNGFGRIGRSFLRSVMSDKKALESLNIAALNIGPADIQSVAHSFKYDTIMGTYPGDVAINGNKLMIDGNMIEVFAEVDPSQLPWKQLEIDWVVDVTGKFTQKKDAQKHCDAGAQKVLISAPSEDADVTIILGLNQDQYQSDTHTIVSLGSCTTNALVPLLKVIQDYCGIESAYMTTVHSYTNNQTLLDVERSDPRRSRAAALNIIPTTTGATKVVSKVMPELAGRVNGCSLRVPVGKVSLVDLSFIAETNISKEDFNAALVSASSGALKNIMETSEQPLVSSDFGGNPHSVIVDALLTETTGRLGKVFGWYDNEWGYSCRLKDFLLKCA